MKRLVYLSLVAFLTAVMALPASAGGSWLEPNDVRVEAGDHLVLQGGVSIGQLGWVEDGPFFAYLTGEGYGLPGREGSAPPQTDVLLLGSVDISEATNFAAFVSVEFILPDDLPNGTYLVEVCNDPCIDGFGDLIGSYLHVGMDPVFEEAEIASARDTITTGPSAALSPDPITTDQPVLARPTTSSEEVFTSEAQVDPVLVGGGVLIGLLLTGGIYRLMRRPRLETPEPEKTLISR